MMNRLPIGLQSFRKLIEEDFLYVDKTDKIPVLIEKANYAFLSRPRRFGKSLLISTLEEFFLGEKELFKGLAIYNYPKWQKHPLIRLDFSRYNTNSVKDFEQSLMIGLKRIANHYEINLEIDSVTDYFTILIEELSLKIGSRVVILIDEYDKPITDHLDELDKAEEMREFLRSFFITIKGVDQYIRFFFITGVSRFGKVSLFSGLNQIVDISLNDDYATLLGYTQEELIFYFKDWLINLSTKLGMDYDSLLEKIKYWYNGYSFNGIDKLYNPFSILNLFNNGKFENYWFSSGTPSLLFKFIPDPSGQNPDLSIYKNVTANYYTFDRDSLSNISPKNFLFQTGYLTIKEKKSSEGEEEYLLDFPNYEVQSSFYDHLFGKYSNISPDDVKTKAKLLKTALEQSNFEAFEDSLRFLFAQIPSNLYIEEERFYHSLFIMIMYLSGIEVQAEISTNIGRIDGVIEFTDKIYILEFKFNLPPEDGLKQIITKKYYEKFLTKGKKIYLVGVGFTRKEIKVVLSDK